MLHLLVYMVSNLWCVVHTVNSSSSWFPAALVLQQLCTTIIVSILGTEGSDTHVCVVCDCSIRVY